MHDKKLHILIDVDSAAQAQKSGIGYYTEWLIENIANTNPNIQITGHYFNFLGRNMVSLPKKTNIRYAQSKIIPRSFFFFLRRYGLTIPIEILSKTKSNFNLFPNFIGTPSLFNSPSGVVIHDLTYILHPEFVSEKNRKDLSRLIPKTLKRSKLVICISGTTKKELIKRFPGIQSKAITTLLPVTKVHKHIDHQQILSKFGIDKPFILFIGNLEPRKNLSELIKAYENISNEVTDKYQLVIAGGNGWNNSEIIKSLNKNPSIIRTGYISDDEKSVLLSAATLFVFPSIYEGYGIPILEAFSYNIPVVASGIDVHREIGADAVLYCDVNSADITKKITTVINDKKLRDKLIMNGSKRLAQINNMDFVRPIVTEIEKLSKN